MKKLQLLFFIWLFIYSNLYAGVDIRLRKVNLFLNSDRNWTLDIAVDVKSTHIYEIFRFQGAFETNLPIIEYSIDLSKFGNPYDYDHNMGLMYHEYYYIFYFQYIQKDTAINYQIITPEDSWVEVLHYTINFKSQEFGGSGFIRWQLDNVVTDYSYLVEAYFPILESVLNVTGYQVSIPPDIRLIWLNPPVIVEDENSSKLFRLYQNYPNPFNPETFIKYEIDRPSQVSLKIYNSLGEMIRNMENNYKYPGVYLIKWDGLTESGNLSPSGIYYYNIKAGYLEETKKMIKLK